MASSSVFVSVAIWRKYSRICTADFPLQLCSFSGETFSTRSSQKSGKRRPDGTHYYRDIRFAVSPWHDRKLHRIFSYCVAALISPFFHRPPVAPCRCAPLSGAASVPPEVTWLCLGCTFSEPFLAPFRCGNNPPLFFSVAALSQQKDIS